MQIYDINSYFSLGGINTNSYTDNTEVNDTQSLDEAEQFSNVLQDYIQKVDM